MRIFSIVLFIWSPVQGAVFDISKDAVLYRGNQNRSYFAATFLPWTFLPPCCIWGNLIRFLTKCCIGEILFVFFDNVLYRGDLIRFLTKWCIGSNPIRILTKCCIWGNLIRILTKLLGREIDTNPTETLMIRKCSRRFILVFWTNIMYTWKVWRFTLVFAFLTSTMPRSSRATGWLQKNLCVLLKQLQSTWLYCIYRENRAPKKHSRVHEKRNNSPFLSQQHNGFSRPGRF
jgi:hypothetical protein